MAGSSFVQVATAFQGIDFLRDAEANSTGTPEKASRPRRREILRLFALCSNDDRRHVRRVNGGVEKLRAGQLRKMDQLVSDFLDFSADLLTGFHSQFDRLAGVPLQNASDGIAGL